MGRSLDLVDFGDCVLVTSKEAMRLVPKCFKINPQIRIHYREAFDGVYDYSRYVLTDLKAVSPKDFFLITQWDSWVISPEHWSDVFLKYDYIGAVWPHHCKYRVGNGGFSLRSRRLMNAVSENVSKAPRELLTIEDDFICRVIREQLEREHSCAFAPERVADRFSAERGGWPQCPFGFHGLFNFARIFDTDSLVAELRELPGDCFMDRASLDLALFLMAEERIIEAKYVLHRRVNISGWTSKNLRLAIRMVSTRVFLCFRGKKRIRRPTGVLGGHAFSKGFTSLFPLISVQRILIIATRQIGDVLCTTPLMRRARELWPDAVIDVLGYEKTMGMLVGNPDINDVIESPEHPKAAEYTRLIRRIFRKYDLAIVTQPSDRAHIYGLLAATLRVGVVPNAWRHNWWKKLFSLETVELDYWNQHVVVERLRLLDVFSRSSDSDSSNTVTSVVTPGAEALPQWISDFVALGPFVVIHATPMWRFKRWPNNNWGKLVIHLVKSGKRVVLTGSSSDQDRELNQQVLQLVSSQSPAIPRNHLVNCAGLLNFPQMTRLLELAECYVGVDTSVTHLAAACGIPTIALFGPTPPTNFGPWPINTSVFGVDRSVWSLLGESEADGARVQVRGNVKIVQGPGECVPCRKAGCLNRFESHSACLDSLSVQSVVRLLPQ